MKLETLEKHVERLANLPEIRALAVIIWPVMRVTRILKGVNNFSKLRGFILARSGIHFIINGVRDLLKDSTFWHGQYPPLLEWSAS